MDLREQVSSSWGGGGVGVEGIGESFDFSTLTLSL